LGLATRFVSAVWVAMTTTAQTATTPAAAPSAAYRRPLRPPLLPESGTLSDCTMTTRLLVL